MFKQSKLIVILGPTSSGKSTLAIKLARKFKGEIVSADSRQVYKGMDLGTGKVPISYGLRSKTSTKSSTPSKDGIYSGGIRHHLLDVASPKKQFTVSEFKTLANQAIKKINSKHKLPFLVGGTPFYIYATIDDWQIPEVAPNPKLRNVLRNKSNAQLFAMLKKLDPKRAKNIDQHNPHRLIRALEIIKETGRPVPPFRNPELVSGSQKKIPNQVRNCEMLLLGISKPQNELYKLIDKRLEQRLKQGMVVEVKKLRKSGVSWKRLEGFGLEYRFVSLYLQNYLTYDEMVQQLKSAIHKFSKRQMTWFKRDARIRWITNENQATKLIKGFMK